MAVEIRYVNTSNSSSGDGTGNHENGNATSAYVTLSAAEAGLRGTDWTGDDLHILCSSGSNNTIDTTQVVFLGSNWTNPPGNLFITHNDAVTAVYSNVNYALETSGRALDIDLDSTFFVDGLQIATTADFAAGIRTQSTGTYEIKNCKIHGDDATGAEGILHLTGANPKFNMFNNIIWNYGQNGIDIDVFLSGHESAIFNNTIYNCVTGVEIDGEAASGNMYLYNNIVQNSSTAYNLDNDVIVQDNIADDGTGNANIAVIFADAANLDFRTSDSNVTGQVSNVSALFGVFAETNTDALGSFRGDNWDYGAFQYQPTRVGNVDVTLDNIGIQASGPIDGNATVTMAAITPEIIAANDDPINLTMTPNTFNANVTSTSTELVTFGVPFPEGKFTSTDTFRLLDSAGAEANVYIEEVLTWQSDNSIRAVKVQFIFDATGGSEVYTMDYNGRDTTDRTVANITNIAHDGSKDSQLEPRVFAVHDSDYLTNVALMPPTVVADNSTFDTGYFPRKFRSSDAEGLNFATSSGANWLGDRTSTSYKQYMRTANVEVLREAYVSYNFWIEQTELDNDDAIGGFGLDGLETDPKYSYTEAVKYHLALTGDDSWVPTGDNPYASTRDQMWMQMSDILFRGDKRQSSSVGTANSFGGTTVFTGMNDAFTERNSGYALKAFTNSYELTGNTLPITWAETVINNLWNMKTSHPDGYPDRGYLNHSWELHEGPQAYLGELVNVNGNVITIANAFGNAAILTNGDNIRNNDAGPDNETLVGSITDNGNATWTFQITDSTGWNTGDRIRTLYDFVETNHAFSPWMSTILIDGLWQHYQVSSNTTIKSRIENIISGLATATIKYGLSAERMTSGLIANIESTFNVGLSSQDAWGVNGAVTEAPVPMYGATFLLDTNLHPAEGNTIPLANFYQISGNDQHTPDLIYTFAMGARFETNKARQDVFMECANACIEWFDVSASTATSGPPRSYMWQIQPDPYGTYAWVQEWITNNPLPDNARGPVFLRSSFRSPGMGRQRMGF